MKTLPIIIFLAFHLAIGAAFMYTVISPQNVTKGISEALTIGITN